MKTNLALVALLSFPGHAFALDAYTDSTIPACSRTTFDGAIRSYSALLDDAAKKKLVIALGSLDAWYNINAKGNGLRMSEQETKDFLSKAVCGRSGYQVERIAAQMMGTK